MQLGSPYCPQRSPILAPWLTHATLHLHTRATSWQLYCAPRIYGTCFSHAIGQSSCLEHAHWTRDPDAKVQQLQYFQNQRWWCRPISTACPTLAGITLHITSQLNISQTTVSVLAMSLANLCAVNRGGVLLQQRDKALSIQNTAWLPCSLKCWAIVDLATTTNQHIALLLHHFAVPESVDPCKQISLTPTDTCCLPCAVCT